MQYKKCIPIKCYLKIRNFIAMKIATVLDNFSLSCSIATSERLRFCDSKRLKIFFLIPMLKMAKGFFAAKEGLLICWDSFGGFLFYGNIKKCQMYTYSPLYQCFPDSGFFKLTWLWLAQSRQRLDSDSDLKKVRSESEPGQFNS